MSSIDEIKARLDIVDIVSETVQLRRSGKNYTGFCPFHPNSRTPAFVVFPESGTWRCFGQCNEGGDIFGYVMKRDGSDFGEALRYLADKAGVELKPQTPQQQEAAEEHDHLRALLEDAVTFYRHQLLQTPAGKAALDYLHKRGLTDETIEIFGLGYAPASWEDAIRHFKGKGYTEKDLIDSGLVTQREPAEGQKSSGIYDRFRNRIMIPIREGRGRMSGFGARILDPNDVPKFLNSPQTPIFDKGHLLYGLDRARKSIREKDQAVIVEGYLDVIALHQAGFTNAVSPMGTALTEHQLYLLKRLTRRFVLALDPDAAGEKATMRGLQIARQAMDHEQEVVFDARGLLGQEARLQADIRVTVLPPGMDPDDVVLRDPGEWERIVQEARPIVIHVMEALAAGQNLEDPKVKTEIARQVLPLIEDVPSAVERDTYRQRLARLIRVDERTLTGAPGLTPKVRRRPQISRQEQQAPVGVLKTHDARFLKEAYCLGMLLRRPDLIHRIDRKLQEDGLARLIFDDFQRTDHKTIFRLLQESLDQDDEEPLNFVLNRLSLELMEIADGLLARTDKMDPNDDKVLEDLLRALLDLRRRDTRQNIEHVRFLIQEAQEQGDLMASQYQQSIKQFSIALNRIDRAMGQYTNRSMQFHEKGNQ
ncbi:MAG: DNA primase [Chloroflexi bacterium]|nr:MAG: DNA primase [Chloroflexota bacterium]